MARQKIGKKLVEYRPVPGFPGYRVGDDGSVWSCWKRRGVPGFRGTKCFQSGTWKRLHAWAERTGHLRVRLYGEGKASFICVHLVVMLAFGGPRPPGMQCCHGDGDPTNNRPSNLRWGTAKSNKEDSIRHGTHAAGVRHGNAKHTADQVREIRAKYSTGSFTQRELAREYQMSLSAIAQLLRRERYADVE